MFYLTCRQPAWCHSCDELASVSCQLAMHSITLLGNDVVEKHLSQNQKNKIQLNLSYGSKLLRFLL